MIYAISKFIANLFGLDISKVQRWVVWIVIAIIGVIVLIIAFSLKSCFTRTPKLDQQQIQKAQKAIETQDRKEMIEVLAQSDAQEKAADVSVIEANAVTQNAIQESKKKWSDASNDEMAAELERRAKESQ